MRKKLIALFSALAMAITVMCPAFSVAAAADTGMIMQTKASKTTIKQGETVTIDLMITQNPGVVSIQTKAVYDTTAFEMVDVADGKLFNDLTYMKSEGADKSKVWWTNLLPEADSTETGKLFTVTFKAKDDIENGDFDFTFDTWGDAVYNYDLDDVSCTIEKVTVKVNDGKSDDATLKSLTISNGTLKPAFSSDVESYSVLLPYGSAVPTVTAVANDAKSSVKITQAKSFKNGENEATVIVTAEKGNTKTYTVTFTEINAVLSSLKVNGTSVAGFDPDKTSYDITVSYADWKAEPDKTYTIDAAASKEDSTVAISENNFVLTSTDPDKNTDKSVTVTVTSAQGDKTVYTITFTVLACVHDYKLDSTKSTPATCEADGKNVYVCSVCGGEKNEVVDALGHDESSEWTTVSAGCETDGSKEQICSRCGKQIGYEVLPQIGHKWSTWTNTEGTENYTRTCSNCNETQTKVVMSEEDHTHDFTSAACQTEILKEATCSEKGTRRIWCADISCAGHIDEDIDMTAHTEATTTVNATCTESGLKTVTCSVCETKISETVLDPLGHSFAEAWSTDNSDHWHSCVRCGAENEREAHTENEGTVANGVKTFSCTVCKHVMRTEQVPVTDADNVSSGVNYAPSEYVPTVIPFGGVTVENMTAKVKNLVTGKTVKARAEKKGNSVSVKLGSENNGYYANIFTTDDEYICSAVIESGRAKFSASVGDKFNVVIDSFAYGEDVSSAAVADGETDTLSDNIMLCLASVILLAGFAVMTVYIKKRTNK